MRFYKLMFTQIFVIVHFKLSIARNIGDGGAPATGNSSETSNVCETHICNDIASQLLYNMDITVDPCEDFFKFACGGFLNKSKSLDVDDTVHAIGLNSYIIVQQLGKRLAEPILTDEPRPFKLAKHYYKSCMNQEATEKMGYEPLQRILKELGGWPIIDDSKWNETEFTWMRTVYKLRNLGYSANLLLQLVVVTIPNDIKSILTITPTEDLQVDYFSEMSNIFDMPYYKYIRDVAQMLGASHDDVTTKSVEEIVRFEKELVSIRYKTVDFNHQLKKNVKVSELSKNYPGIPWMEYLNNILAPYSRVDETDSIVVAHPQALIDFIQLMDRTPKKVQANYLVWKTIANSMEYLHHSAELRQLEYLKKSSKLPSRWKECVQRVRLLFSTESLYFNNYFNQTMDNNAIEMLVNIKNQYMNNLKTIPWMDDDKKLKALDITTDTILLVGDPPQLNEVLEEYYKNLELDDGHFFENQLKINRFNIDQYYHQYVIENPWGHYGSAINTVPLIYSDSVVDFLAGAIQGRSLNHEHAQYMYYGVVGSTITHKFISYLNDKYHNLYSSRRSRNNEMHRQKILCILHQFESYSTDKIGHDSNIVVFKPDEILLNGGFRTAYLAYRDWINKHGEEKLLPNLPFNSHQLYWINAANKWCTKPQPKNGEWFADSYTEDKDEFLVFGSFSNIVEFSKDFQCGANKRMNPEVKCHMW